jgi:hypothetical protein
MLIDTTDFKWTVHPSGYEWSKSRGVFPDAEEATLKPIDGSATTETTQPMEMPGLFNNLASTPLTRTAVQNFANTYGLLGGVPMGWSFPVVLAEWYDEITIMKEAISLWVPYRDDGGKNADELAKVIQSKLTGLDTFSEVGEDGKISFLLRPATLRSAIWLQFAQAVEVGDWRNCGRCGKPFQFKRKSKLWCSDTCKVAMSVKNKPKGVMK